MARLTIKRGLYYDGGSWRIGDSDFRSADYTTSWRFYFLGSAQPSAPASFSGGIAGSGAQPAVLRESKATGYDTRAEKRNI